MKQSYHEYLLTRIKFQFLVGLWWEFDVDADIKLEIPKDKEERKTRDVAIPCMKMAPLVRKSPKVIAETLKSYVEQAPGVERVEIIGGYLNVFFDRLEFFLSIVRDIDDERHKTSSPANSAQ
jgi:arginyl-tRNA synthetase